MGSVKNDAKVASVLVPEAHARDADDMPMIWCSGAQPMKAAGLSYLSGIRGPSILTGGCLSSISGNFKVNYLRLNSSKTLPVSKLASHS